MVWSGVKEDKLALILTEKHETCVVWWLTGRLAINNRYTLTVRQVMNKMAKFSLPMATGNIL